MGDCSYGSYEDGNTSQRMVVWKQSSGTCHRSPKLQSDRIQTKSELSSVVIWVGCAWVWAILQRLITGQASRIIVAKVALRTMSGKSEVWVDWAKLMHEIDVDSLRCSRRRDLKLLLMVPALALLLHMPHAMPIRTSLLGQWCLKVPAEMTLRPVHLDHDATRALGPPDGFGLTLVNYTLRSLSDITLMFCPRTADTQARLQRCCALRCEHHRQWVSQIMFLESVWHASGTLRARCSTPTCSA